MPVYTIKDLVEATQIQVIVEPSGQVRHHLDMLEELKLSMNVN